jgi:RNA polymerase sigma-70 factor (ECF subfamily)
MTEAAPTAVAQPSGPLPAAFDWEEVYRANFKPVWRFLARLGVRPEHLEDVTHEVFLTAFRRLDSYDATRPVTPWLFGIAFRLGGDFKRLSFIRREQPAEESASEPVTETSGPLAEKAVAARQARAMLDEILESMDLEKRAVFVMHELDGLQVPEIARALDLPLATAYSRLRLARQQYDAGVKRLKAKVGHGSA